MLNNGGKKMNNILKTPKKPIYENMGKDVPYVLEKPKKPLIEGVDID